MPDETRVTVYRDLTLEQSVKLARWYADDLCAWKPERYETYSETVLGTARLSDAVRVILDALAAAQQRIAALEEKSARFKRFRDRYREAWEGERRRREADAARAQEGPSRAT